MPQPLTVPILLRATAIAAALSLLFGLIWSLPVWGRIGTMSQSELAASIRIITEGAFSGALLGMFAVGLVFSTIFLGQLLARAFSQRLQEIRQPLAGLGIAYLLPPLLTYYIVFMAV